MLYVLSWLQKDYNMSVSYKRCVIQQLCIEAFKILASETEMNVKSDIGKIWCL